MRNFCAPIQKSLNEIFGRDEDGQFQQNPYYRKRKRGRPSRRQLELERSAAMWESEHEKAYPRPGLIQLLFDEWPRRHRIEYIQRGDIPISQKEFENEVLNKPKPQ